jgi:hypothetical protein
MNAEENASSKIFFGASNASFLIPQAVPGKYSLRSEISVNDFVLTQYKVYIKSLHIVVRRAATANCRTADDDHYCVVLSADTDDKGDRSDTSHLQNKK